MSRVSSNVGGLLVPPLKCEGGTTCTPTTKEDSLSHTVDLSTYDTEAMDPADVKPNLVFETVLTKPATAQSREHWEGWLDTARSVRVTAYVPAGLENDDIKLSISGHRRITNEAPTGVVFENRGKTRALHLEDEALGVFMIVRVPTAVTKLATVTVKRG